MLDYSYTCVYMGKNVDFYYIYWQIYIAKMCQYGNIT